MNWTETITALLSDHRNPQNPSQPLALKRQQIFSLLRHGLPPNTISENWQAEASRTLDELQAQGEILAGLGKRYCIAPPTILALSQIDTDSLKFQGDRAYLSLVHQALKTASSDQGILIRSQDCQVRGFDRIRDALQSIGVRFLTILDSLQGLPRPQQPTLLRSPLEENPFITYPTIDQYIPQFLRNQTERWQTCSGQSTQRLEPKTLFKLPTGEYLWLDNGKFYELEPETAVLAMFAQDQASKNPLKVAWDEAQGRVQLQGIVLPAQYARWLWRLSEPDPERYRTRLVAPAYRPSVKEAFARLGCELV
jgi:hypothetical protein